MNFSLKVKYFWAFGFIQVGLQICVIQIFHNITLQGVSSTGKNSTSCNMHVGYAGSILNLLTDSFYKPFLGLEKGMQMLTVITIFFFFLMIVQ